MGAPRRSRVMREPLCARTSPQINTLTRDMRNDVMVLLRRLFTTEELEKLNTTTTKTAKKSDAAFHLAHAEEAMINPETPMSLKKGYTKFFSRIPNLI